MSKVRQLTHVRWQAHQAIFSQEQTLQLFALKQPVWKHLNLEREKKEASKTGFWGPTILQVFIYTPTFPSKHFQTFYRGTYDNDDTSEADGKQLTGKIRTFWSEDWGQELGNPCCIWRGNRLDLTMKFSTLKGNLSVTYSFTNQELRRSKSFSTVLKKSLLCEVMSYTLKNRHKNIS